MSEDQIFLYGGYVREKDAEKGTVLDDLWSLSTRALLGPTPRL